MITSDSPAIASFWRETCAAEGIDPASKQHAWSFADPALSPNGDKIAKLALTGQKRGTAHLEHDFKVNNIPRRKAGEYWILLNSAGNPLCLLRMTKVEVQAFNKVSESFAASEGEGDLSLEFWTTVHRRYYQKQCEVWGIEWREDLPTVCENFELIRLAPGIEVPDSSS